MSSVRFHEAATEEAEAAVRWYNERLAGLGDAPRYRTATRCALPGQRVRLVNTLS